MATSMTDAMAAINRFAPKNFSPKVGMILGSGLGSIAETLSHAVTIPYQAIPGIQQSGGVSGHASLLVMGYLDDVPVVCLKGRLHLYEGVSYESIAILIRILKHLGCSIFVETCAAGSMRPEAAAGDLMMITDHINFQPGNPLVGINDESIGPRFIGMEDAYDLGLQEIMASCANRLDITLHKGVYISTLGPSFETPAEIRAFKTWGADAVGMSLVPEVILARHCGMKVVCVAAITNPAAGMSSQKITHDVTLQYGELAARKLIKLVPEFVKEIGRGMV
jgi:xanthosine phosphorylase